RVDRRRLVLAVAVVVVVAVVADAAGVFSPVSQPGTTGHPGPTANPGGPTGRFGATGVLLGPPGADGPVGPFRAGSVPAFPGETRSPTGVDVEWGVPVVLTPRQLKAESEILGRPIYWAGPRQGYRYELWVYYGRVVVRYLPNARGDKGETPLIVATYPV